MPSQSVEKRCFNTPLTKEQQLVPPNSLVFVSVLCTRHPSPKYYPTLIKRLVGCGEFCHCACQEVSGGCSNKLRVRVIIMRVTAHYLICFCSFTTSSPFRHDRLPGEFGTRLEFTTLSLSGFVRWTCQNFNSAPSPFYTPSNSKANKSLVQFFRSSKMWLG
jgi:hypothetical protein